MKYLLALCLLALPSLAFAQHPCDTAAPASVSTRSGFGAGVCWNGKDEDGTAATATALKVFVDGALVKTVVSPVPTGAANAAGLSYYLAPNVAASRGTTRTLTLSIVTADGESDASAAYTFSVTGGKPSKPVAPRVEPR